MLLLPNINNEVTKNRIHHHRGQPIDKIVELYDEKIVLLQRLLQFERDKIEMLKGK